MSQKEQKQEDTAVVDLSKTTEKPSEDVSDADETETTNTEYEAVSEASEETMPISKKMGKVVGVLAAILIFAGLGVAQAYVMWYTAPNAFPTRALITIPEGATLDEAAQLLERHHVVKSAFLFRLFVMYRGSEAGVQAGDYYFEEPLNNWQSAGRFVHGDFGLKPVKVTIPEGATTYQIADLLEDKLLRFDRTTFANRTKDKEGYLFPDTYFFMPNATIEDVVATMEANFFERIAEIQDQIDSFDRPLHEIITMASLLEKEANTTESRKMIAGILWNRIDIGMPLQVDAVFGYIKGTKTFHPKYSDLEVDSPYNTYQHKGLPPGPIANPGLNSILATVTPTSNSYIFYLTGRDGMMRYSETYAEHLRYKRLYLN